MQSQVSSAPAPVLPTAEERFSRLTDHLAAPSGFTSQASLTKKLSDTEWLVPMGSALEAFLPPPATTPLSYHPLQMVDTGGEGADERDGEVRRMEREGSLEAWLGRGGYVSQWGAVRLGEYGAVTLRTEAVWSYSEDRGGGSVLSARPSPPGRDPRS